MFHLEARLRRVVYVALFETLAIGLSTLLLQALNHDESASNLPIAVAVSVIAVIWNFIYNTLFEAAERRFNVTERTVKIRALHAMGFEGGLILFCVPLFMVWYGVGLVEAFWMEAAILVFFLVFTFFFTWIFDKIFPLNRDYAPRSA